MQFDVEIFRSITSLIVSLFAIGISIYSFVMNTRNAFRPCLVFARDKAGVWKIENVGKGPAINVVIFYKARDKDEWTRPVRCAPIATHGGYLLPWAGCPQKIGTNYSDLEDNEFHTICDKYSNRLERNHLKVKGKEEFQADKEEEFKQANDKLNQI